MPETYYRVCHIPIRIRSGGHNYEGSYVNFPYSELKRYEKEYFGKNKDALQYIKSIYDPEDVFCFPQSIQPLC